jgi:FKBP-type peptidyl-prolyl cis-trans isomerase
MMIAGHVVKAWDIAVATMCAGEKARFFCHSMYVNNDNGVSSSDEPQPHADTYSTIYDIELQSWQGQF